MLGKDAIRHRYFGKVTTDGEAARFECNRRADQTKLPTRRRGGFDHR